MLNVATLSKRYVYSMEGLVIYVLLQNIILDIKQAFSGYKEGTTLGFTKGVNPRVWSKKLKILFSVLLVKIDLLYIMFGNILRYSEILGLLGLIRRNKKRFDQIRGLSL